LLSFKFWFIIEDIKMVKVEKINKQIKMKKEILKILISAAVIALLASNALAVTCTEGELPAEIYDLLDRIRKLFIGAGVIIGTIYVVWGGIEFMMAGGEAEKIEKARSRVLYSLIGLAFVMAAMGLVPIARAILC
jgi:uncharacterized membrane protein